MMNPRKRSLPTRQRIAQGGLLALLTFAAYLPALKAGFVWDDAAVTDNPLLRTSNGLWRIWSNPSANLNEGHYWPMVYSSFWMEYHLWGLHPVGYHLVNVLLHIVNVLLIWALLIRLKFPGAWLASALFGIHPVHVESVAWIIERKDVLSAAFGLLSALTLMQTINFQRRIQVAFSIGFFVLALLSKSAVVGLPLVLTLWIWQADVYHNAETEKLRRYAPLVPYFVVALAITSFDLWFMHHRESRVEFHYGLSWLNRLVVAGRALWFYLFKLLWPFNLMAVYPRWAKSDLGPAGVGFPLSIAFGIAICLLAKRSSCKVAALAIALFALMLGPVLGLIDHDFMIYSFVADRFQYLASAVPLAAFAAVIDPVIKNLSRFTLRLIFSGLFLSLIGLSWRQALTYDDSESLFRHNIELNPQSWIAHNNLAESLLEKGRIDEAIQQYRKAVAIKPDFADGYYNLGVAMVQKGKRDEAKRYYNEALRLKPQYVAALHDLGILAMEEGNVNQARAEFEKAIGLNPRYENAHIGLGAVLLRLRTIEGAIEEFETALRINPSSAKAYNNLGLAFSQQGNRDKAIEAFRNSVSINPLQSEAYNNLGTELASAGRTDEAIDCFERALGITPNYAEAHNNWGIALARLARYEEAAGHFDKALKLRPDYPSARDNLNKVQSLMKSASDDKR